MPTFAPDLVIECTTVCDRQCPGCYAPNIVSKSNPTEMMLSNPTWFLSPPALERALEEVSEGYVGSIAIRGGEPSRHPKLSSIIAISANHGLVFLETHGRWLSDRTLSAEAVDAILHTCYETSTTIKISFDRMHGTTTGQIHEMITVLEREKIQWMIAVTEHSEERFREVQASCQSIPEEKWIFQKKAFSAEALIKPHLGVVHVNGTRTQGLSQIFSKKSLTQISTPEEVTA